MSDYNKKVLRLIAINSVIIALLAAFMPRQLNWNPSFSKMHSYPYGAEAIYENVKDLFDDEQPDVFDGPLYNMLKDTMIERSNYVFVNTDFYIDSLDQSALFDFVAKGNNAFISAQNFSYELTDSLGLEVNTKFNDFPSLDELNQSSTSMNLVSDGGILDSSFTFKSQWSFNHFEERDSVDVDVLGLGIQDSQVNFIKVKYGNGYFFLHTFPFAFTNYYLMKEGNQSYIADAFSRLPKDFDFIWDEHYKPLKSSVQKSPLSVLLRYPAFRWVYWISIIGIILFMIFYAKRRQRPIPIINPPKNESLNFINTLGSLYFNKGSHKDLSAKKISVFKDHLSQKYFMKDLEFTPLEAEKLARKSGRKEELVLRIFELIRNYSQLKTLSDGQIKALVNNINKFYDRNR